MPVLFGYGSLILPTSLVARFETISPGLDQVYTDDAAPNIRSDALCKWKNINSRIEYIPAKIHGFRRYYSIESKRGGAMLEIIRTEDMSDCINGVMIHGIKEDEKEKIAETERGYDLISTPLSEFEYYIDRNRLGKRDEENDTLVEIFARNIDIGKMSISVRRNHTYHNRIIHGIKMLGQVYGNDVADQFYHDFCTTTYETAYDSDDPSEFNTVRENDLISGNKKYLSLDPLDS